MQNTLLIFIILLNNIFYIYILSYILLISIIKERNKHLSSFSTITDIFKGIFSQKNPISPIDINSIVSDIDFNKFDGFSEIIEDINKIEASANSSTEAVEKLFAKWSGNEQWIAQWASHTRGSVRTLEDFKKSYEDARRPMVEFNKNLENSTFKAKATNAALKGLKMAGNALAGMAISYVIDAAVKGLVDLYNVSSDVSKKAKSLSDSFKETKTDIDAYKQRVEELHNVIKNSSSSVQDVIQARKDLMTVQDEMIDKFGSEEFAIRNITDAINNQTGAWERLTKMEWQASLNKFNESGFINDLGNFFDGYSDNIDRMINEYGDYEVKIHLGNISGNELREEAKKILEEFGDLEYSGSNNEIGGGFLKLSGDATEVYEQILKIQSAFNDTNIDFGGGFNNSLTNLANGAKEMSDQYQDMFDLYVLNEKIFKSDDYANYFNDITNKYQEYQDAIASGDSSKIESSTKEYADTLTAAMDNAIKNGDDSVSDYFRDMYPSMQSIISEWEFKVNVLPELNTDTIDGLKESEILEMVQTNGLQDGETEFNSLLKSAEEYGIVIGSDNDKIKQLIELLIKWGVVQRDIIDDTNVVKSPVSTVTSTIQQISTQLQPQFAKLKESYQKIFTLDENGKELFSLDNVDNEMLEGIRSTFAEISDEIGVEFDSSTLEPFFKVLSNGESTAEQVQQAFNNLATTYLYSADVLSGLNNETAESVEKQLEEMGVTNAQEVVAEALTVKNEELAISKIQCGDTGKYLADMTDSEAAAFIAEQIEAGNCSGALATLQLKKMLVNGTLLDTETDINAVLALAQAAGLTSDALVKLANVKANWEDAVASNDSEKIQATIRAMKELSQQVKTDVENFQPVPVEYGTPGTKDSAGRAGKEAADKYVEAFEKELKQLDTLKERGKINEKQYLDALRALYEKYFKGRKKYLDKFKEYESKYLQGMKSLYESAMSGIIGVIDDHISSLNKEKEAALDSLEAQRDAAIDALEAKKEQIEAEKELIQEKIDGIDKEIEAKQDQIDAINDEADAKKKAYDLDKAKYELDRLKNQRTIYEYSGKEKGFIYKTDDKAIRDQQMEVEDIEREIRIDKIEKEIDLLEKQKEVLQDQQEELEKQQAAIDKRIDAMNDYYDNLIANTESYWDNMIKGFEETKSRWEELQELQEKAELDTLLKSVTGKGIDEVLAMTEADFNAFKNMYLSNVAEINSGNQQMLDSLSKISGVDLSTLPGYLSETAEYINMLSTGIDFSNMDESLGGVIDSFGQMAESAGHATGAIIGGGFTASSTGTSKGEGSQSSGGQGAGSDLNSAVDTFEKEAVPKIKNVGNAFDGGEGDEDGESSGGLAGAVTTTRDTIGPGGESGKSGGKGESGEGSNLQDTLDIQTKAALDPETGIPAQTEAWNNLNEILKQVKDNLSEIKSTLENMPEVEVTGGSLKIFATGTDPGFKIGNAYAKGVDGLKHAEKNALRSEYGQPELTVYPNGKAELTTSPIMSDLPKGTVIYNEKQTMDILDGKAEATELGTPVAIDPAFQDMAADFQKAIKSDPAALLSGISSQMENITKDIQPIHVEQKNTSNSYVTTIGDIHLHEVQNVDTLGRAIATRLPTAVKQMMSIKR